MSFQKNLIWTRSVSNVLRQRLISLCLTVACHAPYRCTRVLVTATCASVCLPRVLHHHMSLPSGNQRGWLMMASLLGSLLSLRLSFCGWCTSVRHLTVTWCTFYTQWPSLKEKQVESNVQICLIRGTDHDLICISQWLLLLSGVCCIFYWISNIIGNF